MSKNDHVELESIEVPLLLKQEPTILFGMTGRQVLVMVCGLAIGFSLWQSLSFFQSLVGIIFLVCLCGIPAVLVAFLKIGTRPLEQWVFIVLAWMLVPEHLSLKVLLRTFVKMRSINDGIVAVDQGGHLAYYTILCVEPKDFNLLSQYEQFTIIDAFGNMLNGLSYPITIHIRSLPYVPAVLSAPIIPEHIARPLRRFHAHYLSFLSQLVQEKRPVRVSYYITIPAERSGEKDEERRFERAKGQLKNRVYEVSRQLARAELSSRLLTSAELFVFYREGFLPQPRERLSLVSNDVLLDVNQLPAMLAPYEISIAASRLDIEGQQGGRQYLACLALEQLPRNVYPGWLHRVIAIHEAYVDISLHIQPHESDVIATQLHRKAVRLGGALLAKQQRGDSGGNTITRYALKDVERVREQLVRKDAHLYSVTLLFAIRGMSPDELEEKVRRIQLVLRSLDFRATPLRFQQHLAYYSSLAYGQNMLNHYGHLLTTEAAATFYPFSHSSTMDDGVLLGTTTNGNLVSFNPYGEGKLNANLAVLGVPGSGKSSFLKFILSRLAPTITISLIDREDEYRRFIEAIGGLRVELTADSLLINPFEMRKNALGHEGKEHGFREKIAMLVGFFTLLLGENGTFTQHENAIVHQCSLRVYTAAGITADPATHSRPAPCMQDFAACLKQEEPTSDLSLRLSSSVHLFPRRTHIPTAQHTVYSLKQLPEALQPAATYLVAEKLWSELQGGTLTRHIVVVDEAWFLSKFAAGAVLLNELARRIRKYNGGLWVATQQLTDLLSSEEGKNLLALCETKMLFRQDVSSSDGIRDTFHLSEAQVHFLRTAGRGETLYMTSKEILAVEILASEQELAVAATQGGSQKP